MTFKEWYKLLKPLDVLDTGGFIELVDPNKPDIVYTLYTKLDIVIKYESGCFRGECDIEELMKMENNLIEFSSIQIIRSGYLKLPGGRFDSKYMMKRIYRALSIAYEMDEVDSKIYPCGSLVLAGDEVLTNITFHYSEVEVRICYIDKFNEINRRIKINSGECIPFKDDYGQEENLKVIFSTDIFNRSTELEDAMDSAIECIHRFLPKFGAYEDDNLNKFYPFLDHKPFSECNVNN